MGTDNLAYTYLPKGKPLLSHMVGWKYTVHPDTPTINGYYWVDQGSRVHQDLSARKVTHPSTIPAFSALSLEFPWDPV